MIAKRRVSTERAEDLTARGVRRVIAIFVNDVPLPPGSTARGQGRVIGSLCEILYQHAP